MFGRLNEQRKISKKQTHKKKIRKEGKTLCPAAEAAALVDENISIYLLQPSLGGSDVHVLPVHVFQRFQLSLAAA